MSLQVHEHQEFYGRRPLHCESAHEVYERLMEKPLLQSACILEPDLRALLQEATLPVTAQDYDQRYVTLKHRAITLIGWEARSPALQREDIYFTLMDAVVEILEAAKRGMRV